MIQHQGLSLLIDDLGSPVGVFLPVAEPTLEILGSDGSLLLLIVGIHAEFSVLLADKLAQQMLMTLIQLPESHLIHVHLILIILVAVGFDLRIFLAFLSCKLLQPVTAILVKHIGHKAVMHLTGILIIIRDKGLDGIVLLLQGFQVGSLKKLHVLSDAKHLLGLPPVGGDSDTCTPHTLDERITQERIHRQHLAHIINILDDLHTHTVGVNLLLDTTAQRATGELRVFQLVADSHTLTGTDQLRQIGVEGMVREAANSILRRVHRHHRHGMVKCHTRNTADSHRILLVALIEIATAEEQHSVRVFLLQVSILL